MRLDLGEVEQLALDLARMRLQAVQQRRGGKDRRQARAPMHGRCDDHAQDHQITDFGDRIEQRRQPRQRQRRPARFGRRAHEALLVHAFLPIGADRPQAFDRHQHVLAQFLMHLLDLPAQRLRRARQPAQQHRQHDRSSKRCQRDLPRQRQQENAEDNDRTGADQDARQAAISVRDQPRFGAQHLHQLRLLVALHEGVRRGQVVLVDAVACGLADALADFGADGAVGIGQTGARQNQQQDAQRHQGRRAERAAGAIERLAEQPAHRRGSVTCLTERRVQEGHDQRDAQRLRERRRQAEHDQRRRCPGRFGREAQQRGQVPECGAPRGLARALRRRVLNQPGSSQELQRQRRQSLPLDQLARPIGTANARPGHPHRKRPSPVALSGRRSHSIQRRAAP